MKKLIRWLWIPVVLSLLIVSSFQVADAQKAANFWKRVGTILSPRIAGDTIDPTTIPTSAAKILTAQSESSLSAEVNLGALTSGLLKHTVAAGVSTPATAVPGDDYYPGSVYYVVGSSTGCSTFAASISTISSTSATLKVPRGLSAAAYVAGGSTIPSTLKVELDKGAGLTIANGTVLANNGILKGDGSVTFAGTSSMSVGSGSVTDGITFTGEHGKVTATSVTAPTIKNCIFQSIDNGIEATTVTKHRFIDNQFISLVYTALSLVGCDNGEISGVVRTAFRGLHLENSDKNKISLMVYDSGENGIYLYNGSSYNTLNSCIVENSNNYNYVLQDNCNYNMLNACIASTCVVDENFNVYNSSYNKFIGAIGKGAKLNCFEVAGGGDYNEFIGCEAWDSLGEYGFALFAETSDGLTGTSLKHNKLVSCKTNGGTVGDYYIGSATYTGFTEDNSLTGCYGYSTTLPNIIMNNDVRTNLVGNYLYNSTSIDAAVVQSPDTFAGRNMSANIFPGLTGYPLTNTRGGRVIGLTSASLSPGQNTTHDCFTCNATAGGFNLILVSAANVGLGRELTFIKTDASVNAVGVYGALIGAGPARETINGATSVSLAAQWDTMTIKSDGTNWVRIK